ncbi:hypothetical protein CJF12_10535 [Chryseobacterium piperi]|nr:DUF3887 domain-containing protein [Chryseobacterium piperi]ASW74676.1 hypothetical protein CJF12_10535 [Chryseobacterium piperi]
MKNLFKTLFILLPVLFFSQDRKAIGNTFIEELFIKKNAEKAYSLFNATVSGQISTEGLKSIAEQMQGQLGAFRKVIEVNNDNAIYYYYSEFEKSKLDIQISFDGENKISGLFFVPHKTFEKDDLNSLHIKSDGIELKGTLLQPVQNNQKKLVIFVHGSGPQDRDETIGENKPFKDIAEYLFNNGISSYRYDKRTYSNPETFNDQSTVEQETINDAVNASDYFKNNKNFKDYQIIILGHSQGAYLMPEIAKRARASKYIFMSGNATPLQNLIVEQFEYLHKIDPTSVSDRDVYNMKKEVEFLNSDKFTLKASNEELPMGWSVTYWKYLVDYKPLEAVQSIKVPMFFAQGGRDYQVTEKDFTLWKNQLKNNKSAMFKFYPGLSHLFISGSGIPSPKDYEIKGNVDPLFLTDLKNFILN